MFADLLLGKYLQMMLSYYTVHPYIDTLFSFPITVESKHHQEWAATVGVDSSARASQNHVVLRFNDSVKIVSNTGDNKLAGSAKPIRANWVRVIRFEGAKEGRYKVGQHFLVLFVTSGRTPLFNQK